jgi:DNA modification methylase
MGRLAGMVFWDVVFCVLAGSEPGDVVLDPFAGTGTTGAAALENGRRFVGIELVPRFIRMAHERLKLAAQSKP